MLTDFRHRGAHVRVRVQQVVVLLRLPIGERGELLRDRLEQAHNHPHGCRLHVAAELVDRRRILRGLVSGHGTQ